MIAATNSHMQFKIRYNNTSDSAVSYKDFLCTDLFHQIPVVFLWFEERMHLYP